MHKVAAEVGYRVEVSGLSLPVAVPNVVTALIGVLTTPGNLAGSAATVLGGFGISQADAAEPGYLANSAVPALANTLKQPITGARLTPSIVGGDAPPSLEALQATRPSDEPGDGLETSRADVLRQSGLTYGAQGGLAGRSFAINEMLRHYKTELTTTYDFRALVPPVGGGQTMMRPPIVSEAQMAFALGENEQVGRETSCIFEITREAQLTSAPPDRRSYLVRSWGKPRHLADARLPRTRKGVEYWNRNIAEGWSQVAELWIGSGVFSVK